MNKQITFWVLLACFIFSCGACVCAWLFAIHLLFWGLAALPAFFLQALIRRGGKEWKWLLIVHAIILLCTTGVGGLQILLTENLDQLYGLLLAIIGASAFVGCLVEMVLHLIFGRKDGKNETQN